MFDPVSGDYQDDTNTRISRTALRSLAKKPRQEVTFTCMYPGGGKRLAIDRDLDGRLDGERRALPDVVRRIRSRINQIRGRRARD